jgi:hypothetical protein
MSSGNKQVKLECKGDINENKRLELAFILGEVSAVGAVRLTY